MELKQKNVSGKHPLKLHEEIEIIYSSLILKVLVGSTEAKPKANRIQCKIFQCIQWLLSVTLLEKLF